MTGWDVPMCGRHSDISTPKQTHRAIGVSVIGLLFFHQSFPDALLMVKVLLWLRMNNN